MKKNERKKYGKMNLTLDQDFYKLLIKNAAKEHLPTSTYVKKFLMDNLLENNTGNDYKK